MKWDFVNEILNEIMWKGEEKELMLTSNILYPSLSAMKANKFLIIPEITRKLKHKNNFIQRLIKPPYEIISLLKLSIKTFSVQFN